MKRGYMNNIYYNICYRYLNGKPERKIETLEKILFLMQYRSIVKENKPFLKYKIYLYDEKIRVKYLSDLLRVSAPIEYGNHLYFYNNMLTYQKKLVYYAKLTEEELNERIAKIIQKGNLNKRYFVFKKYSNPRMRRIARIRITEQKHRFSGTIEKGLFAGASFKKTLFLIQLISWGSYPFLYIILWLSSEDVGNFSDFISFSFIVILFSIIYMIWNYLWSRPTKFEIENGYIND